MVTNDLVFEIADMLLQNSTNEDRDTRKQMAVRQLHFLGKLVDNLRKDNNFEALHAIFGALNSIEIGRLWQASSLVPVNKEFLNTMEEVKALTCRKGNSGKLREAQQKAQEQYERGEIQNPPISYTGLAFTDLTYIDDALKNNLSLTKINMDKINKLIKPIDFHMKENQQLKDSGYRETGFLALIKQKADDGRLNRTA